MFVASTILILGLAQQAPVSWTARTDSTADGARIEIQSPTEDFWISVGAFGRYSWPWGSLEDHDVIISGNAILIPDHLRYGDLFDPGTGFSLEASLMIFRPPPARHGAYGQVLPSGPYAGLYVSLQADSYEGNNISGGGGFIEPDDLDTTAVLAGLKVSTDLGGGAFGELRLGLGVVRYEAVDARVAMSLGGEETQELFEESESFASELRYRFSARLGPVGLVGGLGFRFMGGPKEGESALGDLMDAHAFWSVDLDLGVELGF